MQHAIRPEQHGPMGEAMAKAVQACVHCGFCLPACPTCGSCISTLIRRKRSGACRLEALISLGRGWSRANLRRLNPLPGNREFCACAQLSRLNSSQHRSPPGCARTSQLELGRAKVSRGRCRANPDRSSPLRQSSHPLDWPPR